MRYRKFFAALVCVPVLAIQYLAVLPVAATTATFGLTTKGSTVDSGDQNWMNGSRFKTGTQGGPLASISAYVASINASPSNKFQVAIYTDSSSRPGALLASSATGTLVANSWNSMPVSYTVAANTYYWLVYNTNGSSGTRNQLTYNSGGLTAWGASGTTFGTWPASFGGSATDTITLALYATYTIGNPTPPTVSITAPTDGSTVSGTQAVSASASDGLGLTGVQFTLDGANLGSQDTTAPYSVNWNTVAASNGTHTLGAIATNTSGLTATSSVTVNVSNVPATPPTVSMTSPADGSTVVGMQSVSATASDNVGVVGVQFKLDGTNLGSEVTTAPYSINWDSTSATNGTHSLSAVARNGAGLTATSSVTITVNNPVPTPPTVTITAPADGSTVVGTQSVTADASDAVAVSGVQFKVDGTNLGAEVTTAPYGTSWNTTAVANGSHTLSAVARNGAGLTATSSVTITVNNPTPPPTGLWQNINPPVSFNFSSPSNNYGAQTIIAAPSNPSIVYVGTNYQGVWKTTNGGTSWTKSGMANQDGSSGCNSFDGRNWTLAVDPTDANTVYTVNGYGCYQGIWKSTDGTATWHQALSSTVMGQATSDIYSIEIDPSNHLHLIVGSHSGWNGGGNAGVLESLDGGSTWILHPAAFSWGAGHYIHFLGDSSTWLLQTQDNGMYRTTNSGASWTKVTTENMAHGMSETYHSSVTGTWYTTAVDAIIKSNDGGATWSQAFASPCQDGFGAIIGDGTHLYAAPANTGGTTCGSVHYYTALETNDTAWTQFNSQTFSDGPMYMTMDPIQHVIYSSNWDGGVWKLQL